MGDEETVDALELARGEIDDQDLDALEDAIGAVDFASRRAAALQLQRLEGLLARLTDVVQQIKEGKRRPDTERGPLSAEEEALYQTLIEEGVAAGERGNLEQAQQRLNEALRIDPNGIQALFNLGVVYGLLAHMNMAKAEFYDDKVRDEIYSQRAEACYDLVLELEPEHLPSLNNLATLASMRDERDVAAETLRRMIAIEPKDDQDRKYIESAKRQLEELETV